MLSDDGADRPAPRVARDLRSGARCVLRSLGFDPAAAQAARATLSPLFRLADPHLAAILGVERDATTGETFVVTEWIEGEPILARASFLTRAQLVGAVADALLGLAALHALGIAHGDVSPGNLILKDDSTAVLVDPAFLDPGHAARGTLQYLAPERVFSSAPTPASDLYSAGATLLHLITGDAPFASEDPTALVRAVLAGVDRARLEERLGDAALASVVARLLAVDPGLRPADALAARTALLAAIAPPQEGPPRDAAVARPRFVPPLGRETAERIRREVATSGRRTAPRVVVAAGSDPVARSAIGAAFSEYAAERGWPTLELPRLLDPQRAIAELTAARLPALFSWKDAREDDDSGAPALRIVSRALAEGGLLGLVVVEGDPDAVALRLPHDVAVEIDPIVPRPASEEELRDALIRCAPRLAHPEALASELHRAADGSATRCLAIFDAFVAEGGLVPSDGAWVADLSVFSRAVERAGGDRDRMRRFSETSGDVLFVASLLALARVEFSIEEFAAALGWDGPRALRALAETDARGGIVGFDPPRSTGRACADLVAAAAFVERTPERASACLALARRLATRTRGAAVSLAIAELLAAANRPAAGRFARRASALALDPKTLDPALARRAVALEKESGPPRGARRDHAARRARALALTGDLAGAEAAYDEVERLDAARPDPNEFDAAVEHSQLLERLSRPAEALARVERSLGRARGADVFRLRAVRAWMLEASGDAARGRAESAQLFELRGAVSDPVATLEIAAVSAALFDRGGDRRRARLAAVLARRAAHRLGRTARAAFFDSQLAVFDLDAGELRRASRRLERAVARLEEAADRRLLPDALARLGFARLEAGDFAPALANFRRARILFSRAGDSRGIGWALAGEGAARLRQGDPATAIACLAESVERRRRARSFVGAATSAAELMRAKAWQGDRDGVTAAARELLAATKDGSVAPGRLAALLVLCEIARDRGDAAKLRGISRRASLLAQRVGATADRALADVFVAENEVTRGGERNALRRLRTARANARRAGARNVLAEAGGVRAAAFALLKKPRSARRALAAALRDAREPATRASVGIAFARAVRLAMSSGSFALLREARDAARDAHRAALAVGHRSRTEAARELVAAFDAASEGPRIHRDLESENRRLRQVLEASRWINEAGSVAEVLSRILDSALELTGASRGFVVTGEAGAVRFEAARNLRQQDIEQPEMLLSRSIVDRVLREGETVVTSEARTDERFRDYRSISRLELLSVMCAPLKVGRDVIGAIYVDDPERVDRFDDSARAVVEAFAEHAAIALQQARLRADIEALNERLATDVRDRTLELQSARRDLEAARKNLEARGPRIVTQDPRVLAILDLVERVADSDAPVLVLGEPGTGKELIARELHDRSHRRRKPFVAVNAASIADSLVEAELFGYRKGAFTGAVRDHEGLIASAAGGTLFLDEIAEMPLAVQAKLLRVLQDGEVLPVGATKSIKVRFRLVAATNRPLKKWVDEGRFRDDLYWRLRVVEVNLPPLRERPGDVPLLVSHFLGSLARASGHDVRRFSPAALECLAAARYPGNVRELQAVVHAAVLTAPHDPIEPADLPEEYRRAAAPAPAPPGSEGTSLKQAVAAYERSLIERALAATGGNRVHAAKRLGITRRWLLTLIDRYGL